MGKEQKSHVVRTETNDALTFAIWNALILTFPPRYPYYSGPEQQRERKCPLSDVALVCVDEEQNIYILTPRENIQNESLILSEDGRRIIIQTTAPDQSWEKIVYDPRSELMQIYPKDGGALADDGVHNGAINYAYPNVYFDKPVTVLGVEICFMTGDTVHHGAIFGPEPVQVERLLQITVDRGVTTFVPA